MTLGLEKLRKSGTRITFKEENKRKLIENGFISKVKFDCGKSEIAVNCEILCILSGLFCDIKNNVKVDTERLQLLNIIPKILNHLSTLAYPFTRHDISILRSLKNIILNLKYEIKAQEIQFFIDLLLLHKNTPSVYALKNEIINLFTGILKYKDIRDQISSKKVIYILNNPNLNTISLLNLLISPSTYQWIKINHVFNSRNKAFSLVVKWFLYGEGKAFKTVIDFFTEYIFVDKTSLYFFGQVVHENVEAQIYARECGLLEKICNRYNKEVDEGVVYVITVASPGRDRAQLATGPPPSIFQISAF
ncbi:hypothetical protein NBO_376gi001 [Nosema bombycis CQ1]|uniref:Uncharacterized protein n=1 Tax=Nosema bombycis (strain CQ1 / CVCC 102059) TaxID=578461 RepID=R0KR78_NOSB1|nr:hypothetical protein NBO_376gi001 [Nosema bombycis CQ1]|eukprot:EOB12717.1 hypothetical protein NBO_376gi001 [Nosema bombycis CQ1]